MAQVLLESVRKEFPGGVVAVHRSDMEIQDKEFMVMVGPSGCGKTTTLRMIAGLEEISEGTVTIGDRVVNNVLPKDRDIAMVFQNYAIYPHMTVFNNMAFGLKQRKYPRDVIRQRVMEASKTLGIDALLDRRPKALSGGQRQRVALGRAIVREPAVFLFDEPLSNLDAKMRVEMRKELKLLHQKLEATIIYVTHDQVEAMTLGDRVCVMSEGYIEQIGRPIDVYDFPASRFVGGFIGTPPMNFVPGTLENERGAAVFRHPDFDYILPERFAQLLPQYQGQDVELGVRPEDFGHRDDAPKRGYVPGEVKIVEMLGNEQLIYLDCAGHMLISRRDSHFQVESGEIQKCVGAPAKIHLFDGESGRNISLGLNGMPQPEDEEP